LDEVNNHGACSPSNLHDQPSDRLEVGRIGLHSSSTFTTSSTTTATTTMPHSTDTLLDKNSEAWRRLCEARSIARKDDLTRRIDWLDDIERRRGRDARAELDIEVILALPDKPSRHQHLAGLALRLGDEYRQHVEAGVHATWRERKAAALAGKGAAC
jgi:hypothetical protein